MRAGVFTGIVTVQSDGRLVGQRAWRKTSQARGRGWDGTGERGHFKGLSTVSNSGQKGLHHVVVSFQSQAKTGGLFVSLVFRCLSLSVTA